MKKLSVVLLVLAVALSGVFASGAKEEAGPVTIWVMGAGSQVEAMKAACDDFTAETGIQVDFSAPGDQYESLLATKMAANDMPDIFDTSGWSLRRYKEYLMKLNDMPFASSITTAAKNVITDEKGDFYVLPFDTDISGIVYNVNVLNEAGVDVDSIKTWADFTEACAKIKAIGKTPISCGASNGFTTGWIYDRLAPSFYLDDVDNLLAGKFDESRWVEMNKLVDSWLKAGYFNEDVVSGDFMGDLGRLGSDQCGFVFIQNVAIAMLPDANLGLMPLPANKEGDEVTLISSVNVALGIAKDSKNKTNAQKLLEYLARPEVATKIAESTGNVSAIEGTTADLGKVQPYLEKYADVATYDFFDRIYLPSGIWDTICSEGQNVLAGKPGAVESTAKQVAEVFNSLF